MIGILYTSPLRLWRGIPTYNITPTPSYASRWQSPSIIVVVQSTIPIFTAAPTHHVHIFNTSHILFSKNNYQKIFWALSTGLRGSWPPFSNSHIHATYPQIFSQLSTSTLASRKRWIPTSNFTPTPKLTKSPPHHRPYPAESPAFAIYSFFKNKIFNFLGALSRGPRAQDPHFRIPLLALRTLGFFPASPPLFTPAAKRWSLTSVTPTLKQSGIYSGD